MKYYFLPLLVPPSPIPLRWHGFIPLPSKRTAPPDSVERFAGGARRLIEQAQDLLCRNHQDAEHQVGVNLVRPTYAHMTPAMVVLQLAVGPLDLAARLIALGLMRREVDLFASPWVVIDQRDICLLYTSDAADE